MLLGSKIQNVFIENNTVTHWSATVMTPPRKNVERNYSELSNFYNIWNIVFHVNHHIEEKLGSEML